MSTGLHDTDYYAWAMQQAALLKAGRLEHLEAALLAEEIEDMGDEYRGACFSFLRRIIEHLLKLHYSTQERPKPHWRGEVLNFRAELADRLTRSIETQIDLDRLYAQGSRVAAAALAEDEPAFARRLPESCPWTLDQLRDDTFWPS